MKWIGGGVSGAGEFRGTSEVQGAMQGAVGQGRGALDQALRSAIGGADKGNGGSAPGGAPTNINASGGQSESLIPQSTPAQPVTPKQR